MTFHATSYPLLFQDFLYSIAAGFFVGFINQAVGVFFYRGKKILFIKDLVMAFIFSVVLFSFVVSFANYPVVRYYHIAGGAMGFFAFSPKFSKPVNMLTNICLGFAFKLVKNCYNHIKNTFCNIIAKYNMEKKENTQKVKENLLQSDDILVYNL